MVTVIEVRGSAPRALGARMLITADGQQGSIGGGNLEFEATRRARELLHEGERQAQAPFGLGPALNQCCGGAVTLLFECLHEPGADWLEDLQATGARRGAHSLLTAVDRATVSKRLVAAEGGEDTPRLVEIDGERYLLETPREQALPFVLFGAGHVATAFAQLAPQLPLALRWIDQREAQFPAWAEKVGETVVAPDPVNEVACSEPGSLYLVMTHSHQLDEDLCEAILRRGDAAWLGLIGSVSKRRRFAHRLAKRGLGEAEIERLSCPVGLAGIYGKRPATIAFAIAAQLLAEQVPEHWR